MDRARKVTDLRTNDAPAFRLKATFSFTGKNLEKMEGTYTEVWVSRSQWWRETVIGNIRRVEVGGPNRRWLLDSSPDFPEIADRLPDLLKVLPAPQGQFEFDSVTESTVDNNTADCAITKPGTRGEKFAFCFDKRTGVLLEKVSPEVRPANAVAFTCVYGMFHRFEALWFPREMACFEEKHRKLEATVNDLSTEPSPDPRLFKPQPGASERAECAGKTQPPSATSTPEPSFPPGAVDHNALVTLSLIVDKNGKPQELKIAQSSAKAFEDRAIAAVRRWKFNPGTCDGEPVPMEIRVEVRFNAFR